MKSVFYRLDGIRRIIVVIASFSFVGLFYGFYTFNNSLASWKAYCSIATNITLAVMHDMCIVNIADGSKSYWYVSGSVDVLGVLYIVFFSVVGSLVLASTLLGVIETCKWISRGVKQSA